MQIRANGNKKKQKLKTKKKKIRNIDHYTRFDD